MGPLRPLWDIGKLAMFGHFWPQKGHYDKGFPKGGGGGGGPTFGKNSQIISFFLFDSVPYSRILKVVAVILLQKKYGIIWELFPKRGGGPLFPKL